jgi:hypothetical protein
MDDADLFEPETHTFSGVVKEWGQFWGELVTDSGLSIIFVTRDQQAVPPGTRISINAKKFRPRYLPTRIGRA